MGSTYTSITYQIVFHTYKWKSTLIKRNREKLFSYISGILMKKKCFVYQVGGIENHIHIICDIHPTIAVSALIKDLKLACTSLIKSKNLFPGFKGWGRGFGVFSYAPEARTNLINYVRNQEQHHQKVTSRAEYKRLLEYLKIEYDEKYLF